MKKDVMILTGAGQIGMLQEYVRQMSCRMTRYG